MHLAGLFLVAALALQEESAVDSPPHARGWDEFPVFVWREKYAGKPLPKELAEPFGGVLLMRGEDSTWAREQGLSYLVWNVAGRDALHLDADEAWNARVEAWIRTHDETLLVREPCLNDPKTLEGLFATLDETIARQGEHQALGFVLGDEVSLTPNGAPFDLCRCGFCEMKWKEHARKSGFPERAPLTDEVRTALLEGDDSKLGPWLARRRFDRENLQSLLRDLAQRAEAVRGPIGVLGIVGATPFGGLDVEACMEFLRLSECYAHAETRELEWTARLRVPASHPWPPPSLATVFLQDETPDGAAWMAWDHWMRGGTGLVVWSDAQLADRPNHARRLRDALQQIRGRGSRGAWPRQFPSGEIGGIALVRDADSVAYSWLKDALLDGPTWPRRLPSHQAEHGSREVAVQGWLRAAQDAGLQPGALSLQRVADQSPAIRTAFPVLVLVDLAILGEDDEERLGRHLDAGGVLVVQGDLGTRDRAGHRRPTSVLEELRARAPERVLNSSGPSRGLVELALERAGLSSAPVLRFGPHMAEIDWLRSVAPAQDFLGPGTPRAWTIVLLPNLRTAAERRAHLGTLPLEVEPPLGWKLEWIYPPRESGHSLPAGDAAIIRLEALEEPR